MNQWSGRGVSIDRDREFRNYLPFMRAYGDGADANGRVSVLLRLQRLRGRTEAEIWRLLRFLLLRHRELPADSTG